MATLDDINDLIDQLELWNENTDGGGPGETVSVFVWPDEWTIWDGGERAAKKHQAEFGGKFSIVRIPGHTKPFDAVAEARRVFRELGLRTLNPEAVLRKRHVRRSTGGQHTRYIGNTAVRLEHYGKGEYEAEIWYGDRVLWEAPIKVTAPRNPDDPEVIDRLAAAAVHLAAAKSRDVRSATERAVDAHGSYEVERGNPEGPPPGVPWPRKNPAGLTAKGERMYEHVKSSYAGDPRAKEIAARTVLARAGEGTPGLKKNPNPEYNWFVVALEDNTPGLILSGWEFKSDAKDDVKENGYWYEKRFGPIEIVARRTLAIYLNPDDPFSWKKISPLKNPHRSAR